MFRQLVSMAVLCVFGMGVVGCTEGGPGLAQVKGKVTYNGQPVAGANVTFMPSQGPLATGVTDSSGEFTLSTGGKPGAVLGDHEVSITKVAQSGADTTGMAPDDMRKMQMEQTKGGGAEKPKSEIPEKYADPKGSGLKATVSSNASENEFEFELID